MARAHRPRRLNNLRIIGGEWRGRIIEFPDATSLRPTPDRVRETLFNWLGQDLSGRRCLDLFAGSGALGFEALSRNALAVVMVERAPQVCKQLHYTARKLGADESRVRIHCGDAIEFLKHAERSARILQHDEGSEGRGRFDVVFLDPPFGAGLLETILPRVGSVMAEGGSVYLESEAAVALPLDWQMRRQAHAGAVHYALCTLA